MKSTLTIRSILTGLIIGAILTPCNIYSGLKIGWSFNMSITAALLGYGVWRSFAKITGHMTWSKQENVYNQTTASAAASIISGGLVAPIPAYTMITGNTLPLPILMFWVCLVSLLGVIVAVGLRQQMLINEKLVFPSGVATAETINDIHSEDSQSHHKLFWLFSMGSLAFIHKIINDLFFSISKFPLLYFLPKATIQGVIVSAKKLGFLIDPSFLMIGFGIIMGIRSGISLLIGAILCWGLLAPFILWMQWMPLDAEINSYFGPLVSWTLWPGVGLMVSSSLTSFLFNISRQLKVREHSAKNKNSILLNPKFIFSLILATLVLAWAQQSIFNIPIFMGMLAVFSSILLGVVSSRVSGETGIPPIGALGKVTQLTFGFLNPGQISANLMTANVTGGAAGQSSDLLHDLKAGLLLKVSYKKQIVAQCIGIFMGAIVGSVVYAYLIPDPTNQLLTSQWPAPAVATWKSVAELVAQGSQAFPPGAQMALITGSIVGILLAILEKLLPAIYLRWIPSASTMGLAFIIPAWTSLTMFFGALLAYVLSRYQPSFAKKFLLVIAAGFVAGESMAGVISTIISAF
ncbi:MAG: OPT/YSL family transporter [Bdellovibrionales bacterium]|nr:OPT/YSL family transporter [Bdellovibrionales bacterium]